MKYPETPPAPGVHPPGRPLTPVSASPEEREELTRIAHGGNPRLARRAAIVLACLDGASNRSVAGRFRVSKQAVGKWRARFQKLRVKGLLDQPRSGAPRRILPADVARVIDMTRQPPPAGLPRWTTRSMARACGLSQTTVNRIWRLHGVTPHRSDDGAAPAPPSPARTAQTAPRTDGAAEAPPHPAAAVEAGAGEPTAETVVEMRRELAALSRMLDASNPAALRAAVDAVEAAYAAATGTADGQRRQGALAPEVRARAEARWKRARALFAEAKAALSDPANPTGGVREG
jgi:transposase